MVSRIATMVACVVAFFQMPGQAHAAQPLFTGDEPLEITIRGPLYGITGKQRYDEEWSEGELQLGETVLPIKLRTRGKTRRNPDVCKFPPLTVNFKKSTVNGTIFDGQDKLKLVTHCQDNRTAFHDYYVQEYYIYRLYNLLTEESFRVRPLQITWEDTDGRRKPLTRFGFFIEDADAVSERLGMERLEVEKFPSDSLDLEATSRFDLFQFMIANLDWSNIGGPAGEKCCHNSKPLIAADGEIIPIPYDFDFAGVINARYASPPEGIKVRNIRQRLWRGRCKHLDGLPGAIGLMQARRGVIEALYHNAMLLEERDRKQAIDFYGDFYEIIADPKKIEREITSECR